MSRVDPRGTGNHAQGGPINRQYQRLHGPSPGDAIFNRDHYGERAAAAMDEVRQANALLMHPAGPMFQLRDPGSMGLAQAYMQQIQQAQPQVYANPHAQPAFQPLYDPRRILSNLIGHLFK